MFETYPFTKILKCFHKTTPSLQFWHCSLHKVISIHNINTASLIQILIFGWMIFG